MEKTPVLVTLTAPSCAGKSYLYNYIRDVAKMPCLVSTTTRPPRANEVEGIDYFFITEEESKTIEAQNGFAELAIYRGVRYGVTNEEFHNKLNQGIAFLIVEPSGIDHYVKPALDAGAIHKKYFINVSDEIRVARFKKRTGEDITKALIFGGHNVLNIANAAIDRLEAMLTIEHAWQDMVKWDAILSGDALPEDNLKIILQDINLNIS